MLSNRVLPSWITLSFAAMLVVGVLVVVGWIKPYLSGPDLAFTTIYRPKPVPVKIETVKWLTKVKTERVEVPVEVVREVPAKLEKRLESDFGLKLSDLRAENRELVDVLGIPKAPRGGELALTINKESGKIDSVFRPKAAPFLELGGIREAGLEYDAISESATGYYKQDLLRLGPAVVSGRVFTTTPVTGIKPTVGAAVGVSVRF